MDIAKALHVLKHANVAEIAIEARANLKSNERELLALTVMRALAPDPREPDYTCAGLFQDHNCYLCDSGKRPCMASGGPRNCPNLHARND